MTIAELIAKLNRGISAGTLDADEVVRIRDASVSPEAMEAGSDGWADLEELLIVHGAAYLNLAE